MDNFFIPKVIDTNFCQDTSNISVLRENIIEDWLLFIQVKPSSQQTYKRVIKQFIMFFQERYSNSNINQISNNDILFGENT